MSARRLYTITGKIPSPEEFYLHHQEKITAAPSGSKILHELLMRAFREVFHKLKLHNLEEVKIGSSNVLHELSALLSSLLLRIKRGDPDPHIRLEFAAAFDPGPHQRQVVIDVSKTRTRLTVTGTPPKDGIAGFLREKGRYAAERRARKQAKKIDHFTTGEFVQTSRGEVLAVIDNTKIKGEPGIDVRGLPVRPEVARPYHIQLGEGVEKRETPSGKVELISVISGLVKTRYDGENNLRYLAVDGELRVGEVGLRSGGHIKARGGGQGGALQIEKAEFRSVPPAFEARTEGSILVKELVQGTVYGADVTAEMVNQSQSKYIVATRGAITINRSAQGATLYAPEIIIGSGRVVAPLMHCRLHVRNSFVGRKILLSGRNQLILGNDLMRDSQSAKSGKNSCSLVGRNLFAGRSHLLIELEEQRRELIKRGAMINKVIMGHVQRQIDARKPLDREMVRRALAAMTELDKEFLACTHEEEEALRLRVSNLLIDIGLEDPLVVLRNMIEKKRLTGELGQREEKLAEMTQAIGVDLEVEECQDGSSLTVACWKDELLIRGLDQEIRIERPATEEKLAIRPRLRQNIMLSFNYEREELELEAIDSL